MITKEEMSEYVEKNIPVLKLIVQSQWDFIKFTDVQKFIDSNFKNDVEGKYYTLKILLHLIYYNKQDIIELIKFGLYEKIYGDEYRNQLIANANIFIGKTDNIAAINDYKKLSFFAPILGSGKPSESGNTMISDLVHSLDISDTNVDYHYNITREKLKGKKVLIFVDDCLGSGVQLKTFLKSDSVKKLLLLAMALNVKVFCLIIVGYQKNVDRLKKVLALRNIQLVVSELLNEKHRIFSTENVVWSKEFDELGQALIYFQKIQKEKGIGYQGFKKLDFAIVLHNRTPNWSLPLFWKTGAEWNILIQRKTS